MNISDAVEQVSARFLFLSIFLIAIIRNKEMKFMSLINFINSIDASIKDRYF